MRGNMILGERTRKKDKQNRLEDQVLLSAAQTWEAHGDQSGWTFQLNWLSLGGTQIFYSSHKRAACQNGH